MNNRALVLDTLVRSGSEQLEKLLSTDAGLPDDGKHGTRGQVLSTGNDHQARGKGPVAPLSTPRSILKSSLLEGRNQLTRRDTRELWRHTATRNDVVQRDPLAFARRPSSSSPSSRTFSRYSSTVSWSMDAACSTLSPQDATPSSGHKETKPSCSSQMTAVNSMPLEARRSSTVVSSNILSPVRKDIVPHPLTPSPPQLLTPSPNRRPSC